MYKILMSSFYYYVFGQETIFWMFLGHPEAWWQFILTSLTVLKKNVVLSMQISACTQHCAMYTYLNKTP